jgi:hypothetical protein
VIQVLEALLGLWIAWLIRKALIAHYVHKRLCPVKWPRRGGSSDASQSSDASAHRHACKLKRYV